MKKVPLKQKVKHKLSTIGILFSICFVFISFISSNGTKNNKNTRDLEWNNKFDNQGVPDQEKWYPFTIDFKGPQSSETDNNPNPFLDYRLQVEFTSPGGKQYNVPGFFAGDGNGGGTGHVWRVRFSPDEAGEWMFQASFRQGKQIAVSLRPDEGKSTAFDGFEGSFTVAKRDVDAPGFLSKGRLEYVGEFYLKFRDSGGYWIRGGTDSPENFLAYTGFDNTPQSHTYSNHKKNWNPGDPDWGDGKGKAIIGALNYLASKHVNSIYFLAMNIGGDGKDVFPWVTCADPKGDPKNDNLHYDISKLEQWETVFAHAQRKGIFLHWVLNEAEKMNKLELDNGELGVERKLYYRELIARFGHHLAMQWNLCEEYNIGGFDFGADRIRAFADYIKQVDPYDHPITVHSSGNPLKKLRFMLGDERFDMTSIQLGQQRIDAITESFREAALQAKRKIPISLDEFTVDKGHNKAWMPVDDAEAYRQEKLWPVYLSGGMIEFILEEMLKVDDFSTGEKEALWEYIWHARKFMQENLPFWDMQPNDDLLTKEATIKVGRGGGKSFQLGGQVFCKPGEVYAVYLPNAANGGRLDLSQAAGTFSMRWYDPRKGNFFGKTKKIKGGKYVELGEPPSPKNQDWAVLIIRE